MNLDLVVDVMGENEGMSEKPSEPRPDLQDGVDASPHTLLDCFSMSAMFLMFIIVQLIALFMVQPFEASGIRAFEDSESIINPFIFIGIVLSFTLLMLLIIKSGRKWLIQLIILFAVASTQFYVFIALIPNFMISILLAVVLTVVLYKYPEWYVIDVIGVIIGAGAASIFGISLMVVPAIVLLAVLAVYDAIAVYHTKHMVSLAEGVLDLRLPVLLVVPRRRNFSFIRDVDMKSGEAYFMGLGDMVIPSILTVSAYRFVAAPQFILFNLPAWGTMIGTLVGYIALTFIIGKGKAHAGLPFLNSGAIIGFLIGCMAAGVAPI